MEYRLAYGSKGIEWFGPLDEMLDTYITHDGAEYRTEQDPRGWFINFKKAAFQFRPWSKDFFRTEEEALRTFRDHMLDCLKFHDSDWILETKETFEKRMAYEKSLEEEKEE